MIKKLLIVLALVFWASVGWGATYYVSPSGSNTSPYDTWAKAALLPTTIVALNPAGGPHTVYVAPGTYNSRLAPANAAWSGSVFTGVKSEADLNPADFDTVILNNAAASNGIATSNGVSVTIRGFTITGVQYPSYGLYADGVGTNIIAEKIYMKDIPLLFYFGGSATYSLSNSKGRTTRMSTGVSAGTITSSASGVIKNFNLRESDNMIVTGTLGVGLTIASSGTNYIYHSDMFAGDQGTISQTGAGTTYVRNSIIGTLGDAAYPLNRSAGVLNVDYNKIIPSYKSHYTLSAGVTDGGRNIIYGNTKYASYHRPAYISINHDDANNASYVLRVAAVLAEKGVRGTYFVQPTYLPTYTSDISAIQAIGVYDFAFHSRTHSNVAASGEIWTMTKGAETFIISRSDGGSITSSGGTNIANVLTKTLAAIKTELEADGVTVTPSAQYTASTISAFLTGESIANGTNVANLLIDNTGTTGLYKDDIVNGIPGMDSYFGDGNWDSVSFATPFGTWTSGLGALIKTLGFGECRISDTSTSPSSYLSSINLYKVRYHNLTEIITKTPAGSSEIEENVKQRTRALCEKLLTQGGWLHLLAHNDSGAQDEASPEQWGWIIDAIKEYPQIQILPDKDVIAEIKNSGLWRDDGVTPDSSNDDGIWSRYFSGQSDFHLQKTSPCINAGTDVGLSTDFEGNPIKGPPDIGAYEFQGGVLTVR